MSNIEPHRRNSVQEGEDTVRKQSAHIENNSSCFVSFRQEALSFFLETGVSPIVTLANSHCGNNHHGHAHNYPLPSCADFCDSVVAVMEPSLVRENIPATSFVPHRDGYASPHLAAHVVKMGWGMRAPDDYDFIVKVRDADPWDVPLVYNDASGPT